MNDSTLLKPGWTWVKFGDVVRLNTDRCADPAGNGIERYVGLEHIEPEDLRIRRWGLVAEGTTFTNRFQPGQVLFGKRRAYQRKVAVADFAGVCSGDIYVFEPKDERLLPELLPFLCQTERFFEYAVGTSAGSLSPRTNWTQLANYEFALPPLEEQQKIVELLQASLETVESYQSAYEVAENYLKSTREYLFATDHTENLPLSHMLSSIEAGKSLVAIDQPPSEGRYAVLKVSAVGRNGFRSEETKTLVDQSAFLPEFSIKAGDLLITRANTPDLVGMVCLVEQNYPNLMLSDKTLRLIPQKNVSPKLLHEAFWTAGVRQQLKSVATGTGAAMKNISQEKLQNLLIPLPPDVTENSAVLEQMRNARTIVNIIAERLRHIQKLHKALINRVTGMSNG
jgi:type I restriction enzyme S subunit